MPRTRQSPGAGSRAPSEVTTTTSSHPTHATDIERAYEAGFLTGWADRAEYARRTKLTFDDGVEWGWYLANRAMRNAIAQACHGIPHTAKEIIDQLVRTWPE